MKRSLLPFIIVLGAGLVVGSQNATAEIRFSAGIEINAVSDFYTPLSSEGSWVEVPSYGRCWHPRVATGWRPYTSGHWEWTDVGWYWVSDEPWSWACYHYGSWFYEPSYGWVWLPGTEWAPSWVTWRESDQYIGWAPCGPRGAVLAPSFFVFVDIGRFRDHLRPDHFIVNNTTIINRTTVVNNFRRETRTIDGAPQTVVVNQGPRMELVQRASGAPLSPRPITQVARETPVPSTIKHAPSRERVIQEPSRTGRDQQRTYQQQPQGTPSKEQPSVVTPRQTERRAPVREPEAVPAAPKRPPAQAAPLPEKPPGPPTGREHGYQNRERVAPSPAPPAQVAPSREQPPGKVNPPAPKGPAPEKERGRDRDKDKDRD